MHERLRTLVYSLMIAGLLTPAACWLGALFYPELVFLGFWLALITLVGGSLQGLAVFLVSPICMGWAAGAWFVTLIALPCSVQLFHNRPNLVAIGSPAIAAACAAAFITIDPMLTIRAHGPALTRVLLAGTFSGFIVGALFGLAMHTWLRKLD